jgi:hypothetical protein
MTTIRRKISQRKRVLNPGCYEYPSCLLCLEWCEDLGLFLFGHCTHHSGHSLIQCTIHWTHKMAILPRIVGWIGFHSWRILHSKPQPHCWGTTESSSVAEGQQGFHLAHQWDGFWTGSVCVMVAAKDLVHYISSLVGFKGEWLQLSGVWSIELWRGFAMGFQTKCTTRGLLLYIGWLH